ncbi:MAG: methylmalonyl-CoA carboxyltransferase, partial [Alphaproteobacteria bacterium]|nr:methylmalonyl-CoA carboxyltransferase [Alphaproteobacteria bacterium]
MTWQPELDELKRRQALVARMGGPDKVKRQHDGGRLTVRERIERLLDPGSFREFGSAAGKAEYDGKNDLVDLVASNSV